MNNQLPTLHLTTFITFSVYIGKRIAALRLKTAGRTDERVRLMNEIINGIQVIKMYTWEKPFEKLVAFARRNEIKPIKSVSYLKGVMMSFIIFTTRVTLFLSILSYVLLDHDIDARKVFMMTAFYNVTRNTMTVSFPQGIASIAEVNVSVKRLKDFMLHGEIKLPAEEKNIKMQNGNVPTEEKNTKENNNEDNEVNSKYAVEIENGTAKWSETLSDNTLTNVDIKVKHGGLVAVIGPVGSGKTSLLHVILKELLLLNGKVNVSGKISYASQEPWLFGGSVQQNILFGHDMDKQRYKRVVQKCALERDFNLFPYADRTIVGERGISLSGGQRARINLARAVYKDADIYLLDDPLSAVDTHVGKQLFEDCIRGYLREKTVILITHQLQYLKDVDHIIILEDGLIKAQGNFNQLQESGLDFAKLLSSNAEGSDNNENRSVARSVSHDKKISVVSEPSLTDTDENAPKIYEEQKSSGSVSGAIYKTYYASAANCCLVGFMFMTFILTQVIASVGDYFITYWVNLEEDRHRLETSNYYHMFFEPAIQYVNHLKNRSMEFLDLSTETCIYIYTGIIVSTVIVTLCRSLLFYNMCMRASITLHDTMFGSIIHGTMKFFNVNSSGRILNRFSKDMGTIDELLPSTMLDSIQIALMLIGSVVVIAVVNYWLIIPTIIIAVILYFLRVIYITTSRSVKRLEGVSRSPVFGHLNATLQGLTTIRAFNAQKILEKEFDNHQDLHSSAWYLFLATSRAFAFYLDFSSVVYIAVVTLSFLILGNETFGGNVGLAITQAMGLTSVFQWGMRQSAEMENQMTSVERVLEYTAIEQEPPFESLPHLKPQKTWPEKGLITFANLFLKYFQDDPPVLKGLNFTINPIEKVGIVGRTGAGKSSLIAALFQLSPTEGSIIIDNIDTKSLGLHDLRSRISIIPQEPVLFSGTMRKNLDPFDEYTDEVLWRALEEVELKEVVDDLSLGLNSKISEGGTNLSVGQRQLVCLARAIVRNNKILVLDEATANVDPQTDALIQQTIRKKFADCTVLTIAHRLHTIMDSDKVLVMDAGCVVEYEHPHMLLQNSDGVLYGMVQQTGTAMAEVLTQVAKESYKKLKYKDENR
ncbi:hypothetical protein ILUMI_11735 [Ignelater luminosus]|uniref:Multidrug resistance-associated protein lethal(2)03659 n=1 Tax=Ignelater luminosus TaxID=2038154 RepID=A0A8K0CVF0_IGNLU|nr:hypothetical protein ILUMI_11735 [Ignelater luminosus]